MVIIGNVANQAIPTEHSTEEVKPHLKVTICPFNGFRNRATKLTRTKKRRFLAYPGLIHRATSVVPPGS